MDMIFVYITAGSPADARTIGRLLVEERLAACVNILDGMTSIYRWQGAIEEGRESVIIAKTRATLFDALAARVKTIHSYTTPCIVELPLGRIDRGYLDWLNAETGPA
ncbi:MAG: divalent-cation tolerance protein CutA [Rhodospirillaceae bacterium]